MTSSPFLEGVLRSNVYPDDRLWESLCSKALVFVDYMYLPHSFPLIDGEDVIFYDPFDADAFKEKLNYYLEHKDEVSSQADGGL